MRNGRGRRYPSKRCATVLGGAGWDIESLEPATVRRELDGTEVEMAFWNVRAQRRGS